MFKVTRHPVINVMFMIYGNITYAMYYIHPNCTPSISAVLPTAPSINPDSNFAKEPIVRFDFRPLPQSRASGCLKM